jgi:hypothetical protein
MIIGALEWREKRKPSEIDTLDGWEEKMSKESETGKIYCPGHDLWKRPIVVFDNTVQNTTVVDDHMTFLAWNLEFSIKMMPKNVDKFLIFMHLENFSFFNMPPGIFRTFFDTVKGFLDPRTVSKMVFITGDVSDGSANDILLRSLIGDDWKVMTGAEQPVAHPKSSPGYLHHKYWPTVTQRMELFRAGLCPITGKAGPGAELDDAMPPLPFAGVPVSNSSKGLDEELAQMKLEDPPGATGAV